MGFIYSAGGIIIGRILVYLRGEGEAGAGIVIGILHYSSKGPKKIREKKRKISVALSVQLIFPRYVPLT